MKKILANFREIFLDAPSGQYTRAVNGEEGTTFKYIKSIIK
jgi:hypothetical protein